jgi:hypothetical protein
MSDLANTLAVHDLAEKISVLTEKIRRRMYPKSELSGFMLLATKCHERRGGAYSVFMDMVYAGACYEKNQKKGPLIGPLNPTRCHSIRSFSR